MCLFVYFGVPYELRRELAAEDLGLPGLSPAGLLTAAELADRDTRRRAEGDG